MCLINSDCLLFTWKLSVKVKQLSYMSVKREGNVSSKISGIVFQLRPQHIGLHNSGNSSFVWMTIVLTSHYQYLTTAPDNVDHCDDKAIAM